MNCLICKVIFLQINFQDYNDPNVFVTVLRISMWE